MTGSILARRSSAQLESEVIEDCRPGPSRLRRPL